MGKTIMIVDDSRMARMFIRQCLEIAGFKDSTFIEAEDGQQAYGILVQHPETSLVITDLNMPKKDGKQLLQDIKAHGDLSKLPVVIITSGKTAVLETQLKQLGAHSVVGKPISPAILAASLKSLLSGEVQKGAI